MAPTRMKLRVRRRDNGAGGGGGAAAAAGGGGGGGEEEEERSRESSGGGRSRSSRKKTSSAAAAASPPPSSPSPSSSAPGRAAAAAVSEEASPDSKCPICLDRFNNLAYLDRCLHRFCFPCIQEWSHSKAECPLCKQPFASILHSVRAEDDFKEYTLRPAPANGSVAATVAMVAAMASAARSDQEMSAEEEEEAEQGMRGGGVELGDRGVIFEGLTGLGGAVAPVGPNDRSSRRLMTRLAARRRLQREGGSVRRLRERETLAFRRALYRSGIRVRGVAGGNGNQGQQQQQQQRDVTAESYRRNPAHLNRLRPWLRRELTVLYGAHGSLVDIVQRIITARLARHGLEDPPTVEEELRPFLLARTDHFLHELVSFARSPLSLESYDLQAVYEPPADAQLDAPSSSTDDDSVIAISEEEEEGGGRGSLSLSAWDDETPGPSYSTAEPSHSPTPLSLSPARQEAANEEAEQREGRGREEEEEECLIVGYVKPMAERTPELVQLSSDTEEEEEERQKEEKKKKEEETLPALPSVAPPAPPSPPLPPPPYPQSLLPCQAATERRGRPTDRRRGRRAGNMRARRLERARRLVRARHLVRARAPGRAARAGADPAGTRQERGRGGGRETGGRRERETGGAPATQNPPAARPRGRGGQPPPPPPLPLPLPLSPAAARGNAHHGDKPGGKRKYKSRHLDDEDDPTWQPAAGRHGDKRRERKRRRTDGGKKERGRRENSLYRGESRRCREGRSPSVEIIYEGTVTAAAAAAAPQPPAHKRRRKRHRKPQHSSPPVVITIDSDSSHDDVNNSSSPLSSQQPIDFSDLPPLPLVDSGGVGGDLDTDISELPVDILERGSDRSETEPDGQSKAADPVAIDDSDDDVDVENDEDGGRLPGRDEEDDNSRAIDFNKAPPVNNERRPFEKLVTTTTAAINQSFVDVTTCREAGVADRRSQPMRERDTGLAARDRNILLDGEVGEKDVGVANSDTRLLATILNDLEGIAEPKRDVSLNFHANRSPDHRKKHFRGQPQVWLAEEKRVVVASRDLDPGLNPHSQHALPQDKDGMGDTPSPTRPPSFPAPPPLRRLKAWRACEEARDVPPPLKHTSPVSSSNRNTPPPLKHKDAASLSPVDLRSPPVDAPSPPAASRFDSRWDVDAGSVGVIPPVDLHLTAAVSPVDPRRAAELPNDDQPIPPISTLKRHFANAAASRGERDSTSGVPTVDLHSSHHLAPIDSHSNALAGSKGRGSTVGFRPTGHTAPTDSRSSGSGSKNRLSGADGLADLDLPSFPAAELHSSGVAPPTVGAKETPASGLAVSLIELHPMNSVSSVDFHSSRAGRPRERPAHSDSTSRVGRKAPPASCRPAPVDPRPSGGVSAKDAPASGHVFSGVGCKRFSPPVCVSPPSSPIHFHSSSEVANTERPSERPVSSRVSSMGKPAPGGRLSPIDLHPKSHKFPIHPHSSSAASERLSEGRSAVDLHRTSPPPPIDFHSSTVDTHCNSTALSSSPIDRSVALQTTHRESGPKSIDSRSKPRHPTDSCSKPQFPIDARAKSSLPIDSQCESRLTIDSHSNSSQRDSSFCPSARTDNHIVSSPPPAEDQWNCRSPIDTRSNTQLPIDEHEGAGSIWNTHTHSAT
ncbi:uncharacterized protein LOC139922786 [Centroberyx gerrardi]